MDRFNVLDHFMLSRLKLKDKVMLYYASLTAYTISKEPVL
jgi:hypothetical protein